MPSALNVSAPLAGADKSGGTNAVRESPSGSVSLPDTEALKLSPSLIVKVSLTATGAPFTEKIVVVRKTSLSLIAVVPPLTDASISSRVEPLVVAPI